MFFEDDSVRGERERRRRRLICCCREVRRKREREIKRRCDW